MIPANIDHIDIIDQLNGMGWTDHKIALACDFSNGYIAQLRFHKIRRISFQYGARLYNFWLDESSRHLDTRTLVEQTT